MNMVNREIENIIKIQTELLEIKRTISDLKNSIAWG